MSDELMTLDAAKEVGGNRLVQGGMGMLWFGYLPRAMRTAAQNAQVDAWLNTLEVHDDAEEVPEIQGDEVKLWRYERAANHGSLLHKNWQKTGSCVHGGGEGALSTRMALEALFGLVPESVETPWGWIAYAAARARGGSESEGDGAVASWYAEELGNVGFGTLDIPGIPKPEILDCEGNKFGDKVITHTKEEEYFLSSIRNYKPEWKTACKKHKARLIWVKSADEAVKQLRRGRPLTWAGDWGGLMACPTAGNPPVLFCKKRYDSWAHQEYCPGWWNHPDLDSIFNINNQWYRLVRSGVCVSLHGIPPDDSPPGSYWIPHAEMDYQCRTGEVVAIDNVTGIIRNIDWSLGI